MNRRDKLTIRPVELQDLEQFNDLFRYVFQVTNEDLEESGYDDEELIIAKKPILEKSEILGWFTEDNELVSQICIYPIDVNVHGQIYHVGGVTGVGTYPEYAHMGLMSALIQKSLEKMRNDGQCLSLLYPYAIPYYRRKGWEIVSDMMSFEIKDSQLPSYKKVPGYVERLDIDDPQVYEVYDRFARTNHGAMIRDEFAWSEFWRWENEDERLAGVYYDGQGQATGYVLYWVANDIFYFKEMVYLNQEAYDGLWNFIVAHDSMIDVVKGKNYKNEPIAFRFQDSAITETITPYFMGRIVDVEAFLTRYPFIVSKEFQPFHFTVSDPLAQWNNGSYTIECNEGVFSITRQAKGPEIRVDIQTLTSLLMSYRSPGYFRKLERLAVDDALLRILEATIPDEQPYFSDYF